MPKKKKYKKFHSIAFTVEICRLWLWKPEFGKYGNRSIGAIWLNMYWLCFEFEIGLNWWST